MAFRSDASRRAAFARMNSGAKPAGHYLPKIHGFPLHGRGGRARFNRALAGAVGAGGLGIGLYAATDSGRIGPQRSLTGLTGYQHAQLEGRPPYASFHAGPAVRPAQAGEARAFEMLTHLAPRRARRALRALGIEQRGRPGRGLPRLWEAPGVPGDARLKAFLRPAVARRIEQGSLWNVLGRGRLLDLIQNTSAMAQEKVGNLASQPLRRLANVVERHLGTRLTRGERVLLHWDSRLARRALVAGRRLTVRAGRKLAIRAAKAAV